MKFLVLGAGTQGSAAAYDLLSAEGGNEVTIADLDFGGLHPALKPHLGGGSRLQTVVLDANRSSEVLAAMEGADGVLSALPYYFNAEMARLALNSGCHFTDLGGNTAVVAEQQKLDARARGLGLSIVADVGLAPGMVNVLAQGGIDRLDSTESVRMWVGGLPQHPKPPLNYQIVYSLEGMLDYYVTPAEVLRGGRREAAEALSGLETVEFPPPIGPLEAFHTGGGASTLPARYEGRIDTLAYKTLRYPGHARTMRAIRDLGLLSDQETDYDGTPVNPRRFFIQQVTPHLTNSDGDDLVVVRVEATGLLADRPTRIRYNVVDRYDPATGITAMARTTGFSLAIVALMQVRGEVTSVGVGTPDIVIPVDTYVGELERRGISVEQSQEDA